MRWLKLITVAKNCFFRYFELKISGSCAELSYYLLFSLFPIIMTTSALTYIVTSDAGMFFDLFQKLLPNIVFKLFFDFQEYIRSHNNAAVFSFGILLSLYSIAKYIKCLKEKINEINMHKNTRTMFGEWVLSFAFSVFMVVAFGITFLLQTIGEEILVIISKNLSFIPDTVIDGWNFIRFIAIGIYVFVLLFLIYKTITHSPCDNFDILSGAFFATLMWIAVSAVFSFYVDNISNYSTIYGSIAAFIVLMLWLFILNNIILCGALFCKEMGDYKKTTSFF